MAATGAIVALKKREEKKKRNQVFSGLMLNTAKNVESCEEATSLSNVRDTQEITIRA